MRTIFLFISLVISASLSAEMISSTRFESAEAGKPFLLENWKNEGFSTGTWDNGLKDRTIIDTTYSVSGRKSLRVEYPKGGVGPQETGAQVELKFPSRDVAYMSYWMRFSDNFSFGTTNEGGKLPGLCGGNNCSGGDNCDGTNGFSARFMWRAGGQIVLYLYHMDKPEKYGEDHPLKYADGSNVIFERGTWHHIEERVKINSAGDVYDGEVQAWVDGKEVLSLKGLRFTNNGDKVDKLYISTFHGGDDETWAPTETCHIWFDDIRIGTSRIESRLYTCAGPSLGKNRALCAGSPILLSASDADYDSYVWTKGNTLISNSKSITVDKSGTYTLAVDSGWCAKKSTVYISEQLEPNLGKDRAICKTSFEILESGIESKNNLSYQWLKDGRDLQTTEPSIKVKDAGTYTVKVKAEGCEEASANVRLTSKLLNIQDVTDEPGKTVEIKPSPSKDYIWKDENGLPFSIGNSCKVEIPNGEKYIYVSDADSYSGYVGKKSISVNESFTENRFDRKMRFETFRDVTIDSLSIYTADAQDVVLRIITDGEENIVWEQKYPGLGIGEHRLPINATLTKGKYMMDAVGSTGRLRHSNQKDTDIKFPYTVDGIITITGSNVEWIDASPYYLFFYNWKISAGNTCASTPVKISNINDVSNLSEMPNDVFIVYKRGSKINIIANDIIKEVKVTKANGKEKIFKANGVINNCWEISVHSKEPMIIRVQTIDGKIMTQKLVY